MNLSRLGLAVLLIAGPLGAVADDLEDAFEGLKEAEAKKDAAQVKKMAVETCTQARQITSQAAPEGAEEKEIWTRRVARAREIEQYAEWALSAMAAQAGPAAAADLLGTLEQINPKSKYLAEAYGRYFLALSQSGAASKVPAVAEKAVEHFPENEDVLLVLAETAMSRKQEERALNYANRLLAVMGRKARPEGVSAADWDRKRALALGRGHWIAGYAHWERKEYFQADTDLRAALPLVKGDQQTLAAVLFHLGLANYEIGRLTLNKARVLEAARFSDQAAAIKGPLAEQAWRNGGVMRQYAAKMR